MAFIVTHEDSCHEKLCILCIELLIFSVSSGLAFLGGARAGSPEILFIVWGNKILRTME